jgi:aryl-alcohol dehydrogenase-like predicted oxidoreductase
MPLNHYVTLGRSGLRVSPLCLGAMTFGLDWGWGCDVEVSKRIIDVFMERGGNFIDTANIYTKGHAEAIIGEHIGGDAAKRDRAVIATKFLGNLYPGNPNAGGAHRKAMMRSCEHSLRRLKTDSIDLYWMHWNDIHTPIEETMRALDDLVRAGKVRYIGFSDTPAWKCARAQTEAHFRGWSPLIALQIEYSLMERTPEAELLPMARELGMGVTPWSPLKGGILTGKYSRENAGKVEAARGGWVTDRLNERTYAIIDVLRSVAAEAECTPAQAALAWVQGRPGVTSTIIGARTVEQLEDNLGALDVALSPQHIAALDEVSQPLQMPFPYEFLRFTANSTQGGTTINGRTSDVWHLSPKSDEERW